jgi:hypothetical protein
MDFDFNFCHERERLFQRYNEALQALATTIGHLMAEVDQPTNPQVISQASEAQATTEEAKVAYCRHIAEHGC